MSNKTYFFTFLTYLRKMWSSLLLCGFRVASNRGKKMFSSILAKLGTSFFDLNMSLKEKKKGIFDNSTQAVCTTKMYLGCSLYSRHLNHPLHVWWVHLVLNEPFCQTFPFFRRASIDRQTWLSILVLTLLQVMGHLLKDDKESALICFCLDSNFKCVVFGQDTFIIWAKYSPLM